MKRIFSAFLAAILIVSGSVAPAADRKPLVQANGTRPLPAGDNLLVLDGIQIGHASDTTLTRGSAGNLSVEGNLLYRQGGTDVAIGDGGTGASTASAARINLLPSLSGNALKVLRVNAGETDFELATVSGGGLSDGDYGDISVGGSGTTLTIDNSAVTLAKIANAAANSKLVGSGASGSGAAYSEITLGSGLAMTGTTLSVTSGASSGQLIGVQTITTTGAGTYTPTAGTNAIIIEMVGAGGGGAGIAQAGASNTNFGNSGGGGAYLIKRLTVNFSGASYVVGAKGAGGAAGNNAGASGSDTTFTDTAGSPTTYTAAGGVGGPAGAASSSHPRLSSIAAGGAATNGDVNQAGGYSGFGIAASATNLASGMGGASHFSSGAGPVRTGSANTSIAGNAAGGKGGGGSSAIGTGTGAAAAGGDGSDGMIRILEYN